MKYLSVLVVTFMIAVSGSFAQNAKTLYIAYNNDCMTRLQYATTYGNKSDEVHYYASSKTNTTLVMMCRKTAPVSLNKLPASIQSCEDVSFNRALAWQCNTGDLEVYVVSRVDNGYQARYVESISMIKHIGSEIDYNSFQYGFRYDNRNLDPTLNLSNTPEFTEVMYRGNTGMNCVDVYTFRKTTKNTCANYTDISFSPQLGMLKATEYINPNFIQKGHEIRSNLELVSVNHIAVDQFVNELCKGTILNDPKATITDNAPIVDFTPKGKTAPATPATPQETPAVDFYSAPDIASEYGEPTAEISDSNFVSACNAYTRPGYYIVRPKENLYAISRKTGISVDQLAEWNNIEDESYVPLCTELILSQPEPSMYDDFIEKTVKDATKEEEEETEVNIPDEAEIPTTYEDVTTTDKNVNIKPTKEVKKQGENGIHIVRKGETLYSIARVYGYTSEKFIEMNGLNTDIVTPGMKLFTSDCACETPDAYDVKGVQFNSITHTLAAGETLYQISKKYGVSVERIMQDNDIQNEKSLAIGEVLTIRK